MKIKSEGQESHGLSQSVMEGLRWDLTENVKCSEVAALKTGVSI